MDNPVRKFDASYLDRRLKEQYFTGDKFFN